MERLSAGMPLFVSSPPEQRRTTQYDGIRKVVELIERKTGIARINSAILRATNLVLKGMNLTTL